jgi:hypothetical protein
MSHCSGAGLGHWVPRSCLRYVTGVRGWAGGEDAGHWGAEGEGLGAQVREAAVSQQALDVAGGAAGSVRRGPGAAGLGSDGHAPARREPPAQLGEPLGRGGPEPEGADGEDGVEGPSRAGGI